MFANFWMQKKRVVTAPLHRWWVTGSIFAWSENNGSTWTETNSTDDCGACFVADNMTYGLISGAPAYWTLYGGSATKAGFVSSVDSWGGVSGITYLKIMRHSNPGGTGNGKLWGAGYDGLYYSSDADHTGDSWTKHATVSGILQDLVMVGDVWLCPNLTGCWVTTNASTFNFRTNTQGMMAGEQYCATIAGSTLWAGGVNGVCKSTDGGANWTAYTSANGLKYNDTKGMCYDPDTGKVWAASYHATSGGLSYTSDGGSNWGTVTLTNTKLLRGIQYKDGRLYAWGNVSTGTQCIAYSDDGGTSWSYANAARDTTRHMFITSRG